MGANGRRHLRLVLVSAVSPVVLSFITTSPGAWATTKKSQSAEKPSQILAGPAGLISGATAAPDLTYWILAHRKGATNLQLLNRLNPKVEGIVPESAAADAVALVPAGPLIVGRATTRSGSLEFHSPQTGVLASNMPLSGPVKALAVSSDGSTIYALIVRGTTSSVAVIDATNHTVVNSIPLPGSASRSLAVDDAQQSLFVLVGNQEVDQINVTTGQVDSQFSVPPLARSLAVSVDGSTLYVLRSTGRIFNVSEINVSTESQFGALPAAAHSVGIQVTTDGQLLADFVGTAKLGNIQFFRLHK